MHHLVATRVGPPVPAAPPSCEVQISRLRPQDLVDDYDEVGTLCFIPDVNLGSPAQIFDDGDVRDDVRRAACRLGGDLVAVTRGCNTYRNPGTELGVFRKKSS